MLNRNRFSDILWVSRGVERNMAKSSELSMSEVVQDSIVLNKTCFIITPIGDDQSEIRREIDGINHIAIEPVLKDFGFKMVVSHLIFDSSSIKDEIIKHVYESDLVIANLTNLNPNVMYEVALRHSAGKSIIHIIRNDQKLPFDLQDHRTFSYTNDIKGVSELQDKLRKSIELAVDPKSKISNPIYNALQKIVLNDLPKMDMRFEDLLTSIMQNQKQMNSELLSLKNEFYKSIFPISSNSMKYFLDSESFKLDNAITLNSSGYKSTIIDLPKLSGTIVVNATGEKSELKK